MNEIHTELQRIADLLWLEIIVTFLSQKYTNIEWCEGIYS